MEQKSVYMKFSYKNKKDIPMNIKFNHNVIKEVEEIKYLEI